VGCDMETETNKNLPTIDEGNDLKFYKILMVFGLIIFFIGMSIVMATNGADYTLHNAPYINIGKFIATIGLGIFTIGQLLFAYSKNSIELKLKYISLAISGIIIILLVYALVTQFIPIDYW
jgi:uncharacterized membrane protein YidH (DUF202 family)